MSFNRASALTALLASAICFPASGIAQDKTGRVKVQTPWVASSAYMQIEGIDGESMDVGHEKWIRVGSLDWGPDAAPPSRPRGGAGEVVLTRGLDGSSPELVETIDRFREKTGSELNARRRARVEWRLREILEHRFMDRVERDVLGPGEMDALLDRIARRDVDPYSAAESVLARVTGAGGAAPAGLSLDHVGVAVRDASELTALFDRLFGLRTGPPEDVGPHRVRFVETVGTTVELVEATSPDAPIAKFLEKRGPGLHHLCLLVPDIEAAIARLKERGVQLIDERPRPGAHGSRIAFLKPASVGGLLVELKQK